jgi:hypothetical protein
MSFNHQSLIGFLTPQGPSSKETHGLLTSTTLLLQEVLVMLIRAINNSFKAKFLMS